MANFPGSRQTGFHGTWVQKGRREFAFTASKANASLALASHSRVEAKAFARWLPLRDDLLDGLAVVNLQALAAGDFELA